MVEQQYQTFGRRVGAYFLDRLPFYGLQQATVPCCFSLLQYHRILPAPLPGSCCALAGHMPTAEDLRWR